MYHELATHFFRKVSKECSFLVTDHGFAGPFCVLHRDTAHVTFMGKNLAIEFTYTEPLDEVDCQILCAEDRRKIEAPYMHRDTKLAPMLLENFMEITTGRQPDFRIPVEVNLRYFQAITHFTEAYARMLKSDAPDVLADRLAVLA